MEVVVELLLSLLAMDSRLNRVIATKVFMFLRPHLTSGAVRLLMEVCLALPASVLFLNGIETLLLFNNTRY